MHGLQQIRLVTLGAEVPFIATQAFSNFAAMWMICTSCHDRWLTVKALLSSALSNRCHMIDAHEDPLAVMILC